MQVSVDVHGKTLMLELHCGTHLFAPGHLSVMMYSTMLQSLIMLRVAFVKTRAGESHAQ